MVWTRFHQSITHFGYRSLYFRIFNRPLYPAFLLRHFIVVCWGVQPRRQLGAQHVRFEAEPWLTLLAAKCDDLSRLPYAHDSAKSFAADIKEVYTRLIY
jgi:hypothetical protein